MMPRVDDGIYEILIWLENDPIRILNARFTIFVPKQRVFSYMQNKNASIKTTLRRLCLCFPPRN